MLRIIPTTEEELQKIHELQDVEELQVWVQWKGGLRDTPKTPSSLFCTPKPLCRAGLEVLDVR